MTLQNPAGLETLLDQLDYPMFVVTTAVKDERAGCLVGFVTQCSIDPPRFLVCLSDKNHTFRVAQRARRLAVHLLSPRDKELARLFGEETSDETDKFDACRWEEGAAGVPILSDAWGWWAGPILESFATGDHHGFLMQPDAAHVNERGATEILTFQQVQDLEPGHEA